MAKELNSALIQDKEHAASILSRIPAGRWGEPEDFKGPILFLAIPASLYVSGEILSVDGGWVGRYGWGLATKLTVKKRLG